MKKYLVYTISLVLLCSSLMAQEPDDHGNEEASVITEQYKGFSAAGKKGDLRLTSTISFGSFPVVSSSQVAWRGVFDYYVTDVLSVSGTSQIPFNEVIGFKPYFLALGGNIHYFKTGDFDFFFGGSAGFEIVSHATLPSKAVSAIDMGTGVIWYGDLFHFTAEISYRRSEYAANGFIFDMNRILYHFGIGIKI